MGAISLRIRQYALSRRERPDPDALVAAQRRLGQPATGTTPAAAQRRLEHATSNAERLVALQDDEVHEHLADGTLVMGAHSYLAPRVRKFKGDTNRVIIGAFCSVAPDADFYVGGLHPIQWVTTFGLREMFDLPGAYEPPMPGSRGDIIVGNDCWITDLSTLMSGVTIGNGAVVGTRSVVTKDVEPYTIVAGNPARVVGRRFTIEQAAALERITWWEWDIETVLARVDELNGESVDAFIARHDPGP